MSDWEPKRGDRAKMGKDMAHRGLPKGASVFVIIMGKDVPRRLNIDGLVLVTRRGRYYSLLNDGARAILSNVPEDDIAFLESKGTKHDAFWVPMHAVEPMGPEEAPLARGTAQPGCKCPIQQLLAVGHTNGCPDRKGK